LNLKHKKDIAFEQRLKITPAYSVVYNKKYTPYTAPGIIQECKKYINTQTELFLPEVRELQGCTQSSLYTNSNSLNNLKKAKHTGIVSKKATRRLYNAMDWLLLIARNKWAENNHCHRFFKYKLGMITLTLPSKQMHTDNEIKHHCLNNFFTQLRTKFDLQNYIWKAEKQKNGNIHFHIVIDKYIDHSVIRPIWNHILSNLGYIETYRQEQIEFHKNGFKPRPELFKTWSLKNQIEAYKSGKINNWNNPNSTDGPHSLKKIRNAKAYLAKYLTKNPDTYEAYKQARNEAVKNNNNIPLEPSQSAQLYEEIKIKMAVQGNLWYISQSLSKLKQVDTSISEELARELTSIEQLEPAKVKHLEYATVFQYDIYELITAKAKLICEKVKNYIIELRNKYYPPGSGRYSDLGVPLLIFDVVK